MADVVAAPPDTTPQDLHGQIALALATSEALHGPAREVEDGTADVVCGCGFRAKYVPDGPPGHRAVAITAHRHERAATAVLDALAAPFAPPTEPPYVELTDDQWWAFLVHQRSHDSRLALIASVRQRVAEAATCFIRDHESRIAHLEADLAARERLNAAIRERNHTWLVREEQRLARHGLRECDCPPGEGCNAPISDGIGT